VHSPRDAGGEPPRSRPAEALRRHVVKPGRSVLARTTFNDSRSPRFNMVRTTKTVNAQ
jgi:hypothetical protein